MASGRGLSSAVRFPHWGELPCGGNSSPCFFLDPPRCSTAAPWFPALACMETVGAFPGLRAGRPPFAAGRYLIYRGVSFPGQDWPQGGVCVLDVGWWMRDVVFRASPVYDLSMPLGPGRPVTDAWHLALPLFFFITFQVLEVIRALLGEVGSNPSSPIRVFGPVEPCRYCHLQHPFLTL